jgi:hypothetical protein
MSILLHFSDHISLSSDMSPRIEREVDIHLVEMGLGPLPHDCGKGRSISHQARNSVTEPPPHVPAHMEATPTPMHPIWRWSISKP